LAKFNRGVTLVEVMITVGILGIVALAFSAVIRVISRTLVQSRSVATSVLSSHQLFAYLEKDLYQANEIRVAGIKEIQFICDANLVPPPNGYANDDIDGDGIPNRLDADVDNDIHLLNDPSTPLEDKWKYGYNLADDDDMAKTDDNDGNIDFIIRYILEDDHILYRDYSINRGPWVRRKKIASGISIASFTYFGSIGNALGSNLDGNGDGIIDQTEMDLDGVGGLNTQEELQYITSIRIHIEIDNNNDDKVDLTLDTEIYPVLLPVKPLQRG